jgi:signal transduction histidine kinase/CheY-like chemotaxis protein
VLSGKLAIIEYRERNADGEWRRMRSAWMGVRQHHTGGWEVVGVTEDLTELVTERDRAMRGEEAARAAAEAKAQFLANISHELRTPMNGVLGSLYLIRNADSATERQRLTDEAINAGGDLSRLLGDIVDYADADAGRVRIEPVPVDVTDLVEGVCGPFQEEAGERGLAFVIHNPVTGRVNLDPSRVRQILGCLLANALKFTLQGRIDVRVSQIGAGEEAALQFEIEDTGVGIPSDKQAALFGQFQQADGSATRRFGGVGLGLARAKALAELMGGSIDFTSVEGFGSVFHAIVSAPACNAAGADDGQTLAGLKVLLVEDNATNRLVGSRMLESLGAEVVCAENGELGVDAAIVGGFDLIFMDIQMPVMDGLEATRRIRACDGALAQTPIIALTANVLDHQVRAYGAAGMDGCISKPVSPAAMIAEIARLADLPVAANVA